MTTAIRSVFVVGAKRTPFGSFGGSLKGLTATDLGAHAASAALSAANVDPSAVDAVFFGNVVQSSPDAPYLARHVGLRAGCPIDAPALTVNRLCGSGFETVAQGLSSILLGEAEIVACGGTENMSAAPLTIDGNAARWGTALGKGLEAKDSLWAGLTDSLANTPMGVTAENLAERHGVTREECDEYAILSQTRWGRAQEAGHFDLEMAPVEIETKKGTKIVSVDEHPRPESTLERISSLAPVFKKNGVVTAANASGISDGAGCVLLASEEAVRAHDLEPLARVVSCHASGCEPEIMGVGPVPAIRGALRKAGLSDLQRDVDRVEINEAFAAQYLACERELGLDRDVTNVNGGAIAIGHPLGASGSRIVAHLANEFRRSPSTRRAVGAACVGGGQGVAIVLERA